MAFTFSFALDPKVTGRAGLWCTVKMFDLEMNETWAFVLP